MSVCHEYAVGDSCATAWFFELHTGNTGTHTRRLGKERFGLIAVIFTGEGIREKPQRVGGAVHGRGARGTMDAVRTLVAHRR